MGGFQQNTWAMLESLSTYKLEYLPLLSHLSELFEKGNHDLKDDHQSLPLLQAAVSVN